MGEAQTVAQFVDGHREEVHSGLLLLLRFNSVSNCPRFVLVEVHVAAVLAELVRIVSVGQRVADSIERIAKKCAEENEDV